MINMICAKKIGMTGRVTFPTTKRAIITAKVIRAVRSFLRSLLRLYWRKMIPNVAKITNIMSAFINTPPLEEAEALQDISIV